MQNMGRTPEPTLLRRINLRIGRMGPVASTGALTALAVFAALASLLLIAALGGPPVTKTVLFTATTVTIVVAAPIVLYSQRLIHKLRESKRALKDVTSRLAVAVHEAEQASSAKSSFLANMSHELRTPLNAIIGFSEMIRDQHIGPVGNARYLSYAGDIHASGTHVLAIVNDILDLSKIEAGKMPVSDQEEFDLRAVMENSVRILRPIAERARVSLEVSSALPVRLAADERMVQQILINLLANAVKFTHPEGTVTLSGALQPDGSCVLGVRDNGIGMTGEEISRALVPFGRVENAANRNRTGTGLGLPLSKAMMELHGGTLKIRSAPREGTLVTLTFPPERVVHDDDALLAVG